MEAHAGEREGGVWRLAFLGAAALACVELGACRSKPSSNIVVLYPDGGTRWIDPNKIIPGPIRHPTLTDQQVARITALQKTFAEVDDSSLEKWLDDFKHDANVDRELSVYEHIASAYSSYTAATQRLGPAAKREVYALLMLRSGSTEAETLARAKLQNLDETQARAALRGYTEPPHPVRVTNE